jgi:tetratricopeptide (TPR) repeat protein
LASILKEKGYVTAAFVSAFVLDSRFGLDIGFDSYFDRFNPYREVNRDEIQRKAEETESAVEQWLPANAGQRFFCWVHFYDPHDPYDPPEPYASRYAANRYDGEIAYVDQWLGKLLAKLHELRVADRTLVIVTGDHGEGLGEHGETTHSMFLYDTTLHVPLLIGLPEGRTKRIPGIVRHIDLAPTVLDLLGFESPTSMQGKSLIPMINGSETPRRSAYSESLYAQIHYGWSPLKSLTTERYQFIESPKSELFDRAKDGKQLRNLFQDKEAVARSLGDELAAIAERYGRQDLPGQAKMDPDTEAKLRSLGYLGSSVPSTAASLKTDPKDKLGVVRDLAQGFRALARRDFEGALRLALPIVKSDPNIVDAHVVAGSAFSNLQQYDAALNELFQVIAVKPDQTMALATIATTYEGMGNLAEAERWYLKVLQHEENHTYSVVKLASLYRRLNQLPKAEAFFARAVGPVDRSLADTLEAQPRSKLFAARAEMYFGAGKLQEAEHDLESAIALTPEAPDLHFNLAQIYEAAKDVPNAIANYRLETAIAPSNFGAHLNLGLLELGAGNADAAAASFQKLLQLKPGEPRASFLLAESYAAAGKNLDQALQLSRQGLARMPDYKRGYVLMAEIYRKQGRDREADEALQDGRDAASRTDGASPFQGTRRRAGAVRMRRMIQDAMRLPRPVITNGWRPSA